MWLSPSLLARSLASPDMQGSSSSGAGADGKPQFHYASLSLAAMHFQFGHVDEALLAVHEAVRIAQENADTDCLRQALVSPTATKKGKKKKKETDESCPFFLVFFFFFFFVCSLAHKLALPRAGWHGWG
jgi:hypothetical protein